MIVVIGTPWLRRGPDDAVPAGLAARIAVLAARAGSEVQLVGKVGDDPPGDELLLALARERVAHVAVLRPPSVRTPVLAGPEDDEPADVDPLAHEAVAGSAAAPITDPGLALEAADLELGLRYLVEFRAIVVAEARLDPQAWRVVAEAARYAGAHLIAVVDPAVEPPDLEGATILGAADADSDGGIAEVAAAFAVAVDRGEAPEAALRSAVGAVGADPVGAD